MGSVTPFGIVERQVSVANLTPFMIKVVSVKKECGCTSAELDTTEIQPGKDGKLTVKIKGRGYVEDITTKVVVEGLRDKERCFFIFNVKAKVRDLISFEGAEGPIDLGRIESRDLPKKLKIEVVKGEYPVAWNRMDVRGSSKSLVVVGTQKLSDHSWEIDIEVPPTRSLGVLSSDLMFSFWNGDSKIKEVSERIVTLTVLGEVLVSPQSVFFGVVPDGKRIIRTLKVRTREGLGLEEPIAAEITRESAEYIKASVLKSKEYTEVVLEYTGSSGQREVSGEILVKVGRVDPYIFIVPFQALSE